MKIICIGGSLEESCLAEEGTDTRLAGDTLGTEELLGVGNLAALRRAVLVDSPSVGKPEAARRLAMGIVPASGMAAEEENLAKDMPGGRAAKDSQREGSQVEASGSLR